jgi:hypothetical protein
MMGACIGDEVGTRYPRGDSMHYEPRLNLNDPDIEV